LQRGGTCSPSNMPMVRMHFFLESEREWTSWIDCLLSAIYQINFWFIKFVHKDNLRFGDEDCSISNLVKVLSLLRYDGLTANRSTDSRNIRFCGDEKNLIFHRKSEWYVHIPVKDDLYLDANQSLLKRWNKEIIGFPFLMRICPCIWWYNPSTLFWSRERKKNQNSNQIVLAFLSRSVPLPRCVQLYDVVGATMRMKILIQTTERFAMKLSFLS
jgi:hypothetical protein